MLHIYMDCVRVVLEPNYIPVGWFCCDAAIMIGFNL